MSEVTEPGLDMQGWLAAGRLWAEELLEQALDRLDLGPKSHAAALRYALLGGGKRLRPCLVRLVCSELGGLDQAAEAPAVALELVHTYSLVHDDLPSMDDDDLRRGRQTTHRVFGEAEAILAGDSLQALAIEVLAKSAAPQACAQILVLAQAAGPAGMVGGQSLDLAATGEGQAVLGADAVRQIHRLKTGALISASCQMGALAAAADSSTVEAMARYGEALGALFQARDDVLDVTGNAEQLGKTPGKDAAADKATLVAVLGLEGAREECRQLAARARDAALEAGCPQNGLAYALPAWLAQRSS